MELRVVAAWRGGVQLLGPILHVRSMDETVDWARRVPFEGACPDLPREHGAEGEIEIRQLVELERSDASG